MNTRLAAPEIGYILDHSGAAVVVVDAEHLAVLRQSLSDAPGVRTVVVGSGVDPLPASSGALEFTSLEDFLAAAGDQELHWSVEDEYAPIALNYTSGTTGRPRGSSTRTGGRTSTRWARSSTRASRTAVSTCGRSRCSTATAGAPGGP